MPPRAQAYSLRMYGPRRASPPCEGEVSPRGHRPLPFDPHPGLLEGGELRLLAPSDSGLPSM